MSISGNTNNVLAARMAGVRVASDSTPASRGKPNTVTGVVEAAAVFVWHNDMKGDAALAMYFKVGEEYFSTPDTVQWCERLRPMADWMRKELEGRRQAVLSTAQIPSTDSVDIFGPGDEANSEA